MSNATCSSNVVYPTPQHEVFINFRGEGLRYNFISHLTNTLREEGINVYTDNHATMGEDLTVFYERIKESKIAIAVISSLYTTSKWPLNELAKIKECVEEGTLVVFPVFYKVTVDTVKNQTSTFGENLNRLIMETDRTNDSKWRTALTYVTKKKGVSVYERSDEVEVINTIVRDVKKTLTEVLVDQGTTSQRDAPENSSSLKVSPLRIDTRLEHLKEKLDFESKEVTRFVGVVGMRGIGKTTLAKKLFDDCGHKFLYMMFITDVREKSKSLGVHRLKDDLLRGLQKSKYDGKEKKVTEFSQDSAKAELRNRKVFIVLDDVSEKSQIEDILGGREWLKNGSRVVITTSIKSAVEGMVDETYPIPALSDNDAFRYFKEQVFTTDSCEPRFMKLARKFVDYARGHPLALKELGNELIIKKDEAYWKSKLQMIKKSPISDRIQDVLRIPYDVLSSNHKEVFLDVACFFKFEDEYHVRRLLDSSVDENANVIKDLADRFLINICGGRLEINDLMYTLAMELDSRSSPKNKKSSRRLFNHSDIITVLLNKAKSTTVRGIVLDMSELPKKVSLDSDTFSEMKNLRYLKFFNSRCPRECEAHCKVTYPEGLNFKLEEIRYLHWLSFPLEELPPDFDPKNLIDLSLPYSQIEQVWKGVKDTLKLKWLDLRHSRKMHTLSGLSKAQNLQSVNLEGCTELKAVHKELQNMESLVFLNLRGCTGLKSLLQMNLISLKTLILSGCSNLEEFNFISENLEELYLDGTAIKRLPAAIGDLQRLVLLTLKDCKNLLSLPDSIRNLKALQKLVLSGCSCLESFPEVKENLTRLKTLLLNGTAIEALPHLLHRLSLNQGQNSSWSNYNLREWPYGIYGLSSVQHLCLSNNVFKSLPSSVSYLYHLKWLDLKYCEKLISLPMLPPKLQRLDAHGCISLEKIDSSPDLMLAATEQSHSMFIFTNCTKLEQVAKKGIVSYVQTKIQLMFDARAHQEKGSVLEVLIGICLPSWHLPVWFDYRSVGSELKQNLPRHWNEDRLTGIALCAVVSFKDKPAQNKSNRAENKEDGDKKKDDQDQNTHLLVKCTSEFKEGDELLNHFSCVLGGWSEYVKDKDKAHIDKSSGHIFIGYTSLLDIKKQDKGAGCVATEASLKFEVTDGTKQTTDYEVLKCGFTLIYEPTKPVRSLCSEKYSDHGEIISSSTTNAKGNIKNEESNFQIRHGATSIPMVAPEIGIKIIEGVQSFKATRHVKDIESEGNIVVDSSRSNGEVRLKIGFDAFPNNDNNPSGESMSPGSSGEGEVVNEPPKKDDINQQDERIYCESWEDTKKPGNDESARNGANNLCERMEKPIPLICLVISICVGSAFLLRKYQKK